MRHLAILVLAIGATVCIALGTVQLKDSGQFGNYLFGAIHQRGPTPYIALFMMTYVVVAAMAALMSTAKERVRSTSTSLMLLSLGPLFVGYLGYLQGMQTMNVGIERLANDPHTLEELRRFVGQIAVGQVVAVDPLIFGASATFVAFAFSLTVWSATKGAIQQVSGGASGPSGRMPDTR